MAEKAAFTMDEFSAHAQAVAARFEQRRAQFLRQLKLRCAIAGVLLLTFAWWYPVFTSWDSTHANAASSFGWFLVQAIAAIVIIIGIIAYAVLPLFRYRHYTAQVGSALPMLSSMVQQTITLKGEIFTQLFKYFGNFTLYSDRNFALKSFSIAPNMPEFDGYKGEDYIRGVMQGVSVEISEMTLNIHRHNGDVPLFNGLMILLDINDSNLVLRGKFSGKTVVIIDRPRDNDYVLTKYEGYRAVALGDESFSQHVEAFTTDAEEAARLLTADFLRQILKLSDTVRNAKDQKKHIDDQVAYVLSKVAETCGNGLSKLAKGTLNWFKTGSFALRTTRPEMQLGESVMAADAKGLSKCVHCAFYDDKVLITIPYEHSNLFEPDSLMSPPLHGEDIKLVYNMMSTVEGIAENVIGALPKSAF